MPRNINELYYHMSVLNFISFLSNINKSRNTHCLEKLWKRVRKHAFIHALIHAYSDGKSAFSTEKFFEEIVYLIVLMNKKITE